MRDNYYFSVGCIVRKGEQVLLVRHSYGSAYGKLLIPGGYCHKDELPEDAAVREVLEETGVTANVSRMVGIRCEKKNWYMLLEMEYVEGTPSSDGRENSEALFCEISEVFTRSDCTEITKTALRKVMDESAGCLQSDHVYKKHKDGKCTLYI